MIELNFSLVTAIFSGLFIFGIFYNLLVSWLERKGYLEGFTWLAVVGGVAATIVALGVIDLQLAMLLLGAFVFSGTPMIIGAIGRYVTKRERSQRAIIDEVLSER